MLGHTSLIKYHIEHWKENVEKIFQAVLSVLSVAPYVEVPVVYFWFSEWLYTVGLEKGSREGRRGLVACNCLNGSPFVGVPTLTPAQGDQSGFPKLQGVILTSIPTLKPPKLAFPQNMHEQQNPRTLSFLF